MSRKVTKDERHLWNQVAATTSRGAAPLPQGETMAGLLDGPAPRTVSKPIAAFKIGSRPMQTSAPASTPKLAAPIDTKAMTRMRRGKLAPEARIDLHGMTQSEALPELMGFIMHAAQRNLRMVLVITGKGRGKPDDGPIPERVGVLRHNVPDWLRRPPIGAMVQGIVPAHQRHGGGGALYVYLRRLRK